MRNYAAEERKRSLFQRSNPASSLFHVKGKKEEERRVLRWEQTTACWSGESALTFLEPAISKQKGQKVNKFPYPPFIY